MGTHGADYGQGMGREGKSAPCKACSAFKSWAKSQATATPDGEPEKPHADCPLDREELGRATWSFLHSMAAYYPNKPSESEKKSMKDFFASLSKFYPCNDCASHLREDLKKSPPEVRNSDELSQWLCRLHNRVNVRLGKETFDCSKVKERWKDGWKDGSCD